MSSAVLQGESSAKYFLSDTLFQDFAITTTVRLQTREATLFSVVSPYGLNQFGMQLTYTIHNSKPSTAVSVYYTPNSRSKRRAELLAVFYLPDITNQWTILGIKVKGSEVDLYRDCELVESKTTPQRDQLMFERGSTLYLARDGKPSSDFKFVVCY